ncbi:MAG: GerMN domain-containing protein [Vicinamibacterales bacterium]
MLQPRQVALGLAATLGMALIALAVSIGLERLFSTPVPEAADAVEFAGATASDVAHINATLFYVSEDGQALVGVRREVPLAEGRIEQGRQILRLALTPPPRGYSSPIPRGTTLRGFYVTDRGDAFIDLSQHATSGHPGGSFAEMLTVSALVNDVTANLPAVQRVQILIEGQHVDTLAGHVDLRRPLTRDTSLVR